MNDQLIIASRSKVREKAYWLKKYSDYEHASLVDVIGKPHEPTDGGKGTEVLLVDSSLYSKMSKMSNGSDFGLFLLFKSALLILIHKYTGKTDIAVGTSVYKTGKVSENLINRTLPLRNAVDEQLTIKEIILAAKSTMDEALEHQNFPMPVLLHELKEINGLTHLFETTLTFESIHDSGFLSETEKVLSLHFYVEGETLKSDIVFDRSVFSNEVIRGFGRHLINIMEQMVADPSKKVADVQYIKDEEQRELLDLLSYREGDFPKETIHRLFENQTEKNPENIAVLFDGEQVTYRALNEKANSIAASLLNKKVAIGDIVGLLFNPSVEMIASLLAVLKVGGTYLPLDPDLPAGRLTFMLEDCNARFLLTGTELYDVSFGGEIVNIHDVSSFNEAANPEIANLTAKNLAYIIYTSGTTGQPKGVMISHENIVRLLVNDQLEFNFNEKDVWSLFHAYNFDFSVWEMFGALLYGGAVAVVPKMIARNPREFFQLIQECGITIINQTPSAFFNLVEVMNNTSSAETPLRYVFFGGEKSNVSRLKAFHEAYPNVGIYHVYGITETTILLTYKKITENEIISNSANIGRPFPTCSGYILDAGMSPLPKGVVGELYVGGKGVSQGYINNPDLTNKKFVPNPYRQGEALYKSGDLVFINSEGDIEYVGRADDQIQIRGYRVETKEIQAKILEYPDVKEALVALDGQEEKKYLCAYIVPERPIDIEALREWLKRLLPSYMVPSYIMEIDSVPLNQNGKLDTKKLPKPQFKEDSLEGPSNELESELRVLWAETLEMSEEAIGVTSDFFELGGNSLTVISLLSKIQEMYKVEMQISALFSITTIETQAEFLSSLLQEDLVEIKPAAKSAHYPVSSSQKRMFFEQEMDSASTLNNVSNTFQLREGDERRISEAFKKLIDLHESLRTSFEIVDGQLIQKVANNVQFEIEQIEEAPEQYNRKNIGDIVKDLIQPFNLSKAPLFRVILYKRASGEKFLFIDIHHIISDGVSIDLIVRDFAKLYQNLPVEAPHLQYKDYAVWENSSEDIKDKKLQEAFWLNMFKEKVKILDLPTDYPRPKTQMNEGQTLKFKVSSSEKQQVVDSAKKHGVTQFVILMSAFNILLSKLSGNEDVVVGTAVAGRKYKGLENVVGNFVNTLAIRSFPENDILISDYIATLYTRILQALDNQLYPFNELVEKLEIKREPNRNPLFDVAFVLQNMSKFVVNEIIAENLNLQKVELLQSTGVTTGVDMILTAFEDHDQYIFTLAYKTSLFKQETAETFYTYYKAILADVTSGIDQPISNIKIPLKHKEINSSAMNKMQEGFDF